MAPSTTRPRKATSKKGSANRRWKRAVAEEIELPSGNVALVKRPGMEVFLTEHLLPDRLMPIVTEAINTKKGLPPEKVKDMMQQPEMVASMMDAMDRIVARIVLEPAVAWHKRLVDPTNLESDLEVIPEEDRDTEKFIYTDEVFFEDKSFLFNYAVGGTRDLERFRQESTDALALLDDESGVREPSE